MKTICSIEEFKAEILPGLARKHKTPDAITKAAAIFIDENQVTDADGNPLMADQLNIVTIPAEEPAEEPNEPGEAPEGGGEASITTDDVKSVIASELKTYFESGDGPRTANTNKAMSVVAMAGPDMGRVKIPATARRNGRVKSFKGEDAEKRAYLFGHWFLGDVLNNAKSTTICKENGIRTKDMVEGVLSSGGALVPDEFSDDLIVLREEYGVFRQHARIEPMSRDTKSVPKLGDEVAATWVGEGGTLTEGDEAPELVNLTAKKLTRLTQFSNELDEDSAISIGDMLATQIARAFAKAEDSAGFIGDGSSTYGGIKGIGAKLTGLSGTIANIAGLVVAAGNLFSEFTLANFNSVVSLLPEYADANAKWFVHKKVWADVMQKLAFAAGGNTTEHVAGGMQKMFMGYPVVITQVMPKVDGNSQVAAYLGDLNQAAMIGDRRQITLATSEHVAFTSDLLTLKATSRLDINVHSFGNASGTAASRVPGPIVGLISAAS